MDVGRYVETLRGAGVAFESGLSEAELAEAERLHGFRFPPDLRAFLAFALPVGGRFPNWRRPDAPELARHVAQSVEWLRGDVSKIFWPPGRGTYEAAEALLRDGLPTAPKLIPIYGHRYLPDTPSLAGNPVLSAYGSDIIVYGVDLEDYLQNEWYAAFGRPHYALSGTPRQIPFWSCLVALNDGEHPADG